MAYASASDVAALTKNLVGGTGDFTDSSSPNVTQVDFWLSTGSAIINTRLAGAGYSPIPESSEAYGMAAQINAVYAAWMAERSRTNARSNPGERTRSDLFKDDFKMLLEMLLDMDLSVVGVPILTGSSTRARPYAGGISVSDKETVRANTDRTTPRFGRDMNSDPLRPRNGDWS